MSGNKNVYKQPSPVGDAASRLDPLGVYERSIAWTRSKLVLVDDDLTRSTPCAEWDLPTLLFHIIAGLTFFEEMARAGKVSDPAALPLPDFRQGRPLDLFDSAAASAVREWTRVGRLDQTCEMPFGSMPGGQALGIHSADVLIHGWDIAVAIGVDSVMDDDLCEYALAVEQKLVTADMRGEQGAFGPAVQSSDGDSAQERLLAFVGRSP